MPMLSDPQFAKQNNLGVTDPRFRTQPKRGTSPLLSLLNNQLKVPANIVINKLSIPTSRPS